MTLHVAPERECAVHGPRPGGEQVSITCGPPEIQGIYCLVCMAEQIAKTCRRLEPIVGKVNP